jgi:DNA-binding HxlR family transcriptional regulator
MDDAMREMNCSVARALGVVGERWSLLVIREAIMGSTRFDEFHARLGVARNILAARLSSLVEAGVLEKTASARSARIYDYKLTKKGWDLLPVIAALMHWGDAWVDPGQGPPVVLVDKKSGKPIPRVVVRRSGGDPIARNDIMIQSGRGASPKTRARLSHGIPLS